MADSLVLLHGFTHTGASWAPVRRALAERYTALAPDIRGHGSSSELEPVTLAAVLSDLDAAAPGEFTLAGYSMGGRVALHAALAFRERIARLVLIGASPGIADPAERSARLASDARLAGEIEGLAIDQFAARWARTPVLADQPAAVRAAVDEDRRRNTPAGLARALRGLGTGALPSLWERLGELTMPVTLVVGERDQKFTAIAEAMEPLIARGEVVVVPGTGHAVHLEAPAALAAIIARR